MPSSSNRLIGIDVTYAVAIMGCVIYAFFYTMGGKVQGALTHTMFNVFVDLFPAAFFFLNGFTVTLTMRDRKVSNRKLLSYLGKRGSVLLLIGLALCPVWPMNIFVASGIMYFVAPFVAQWNNMVLRIFLLLTVVFGVILLYLNVPTYTVYSLPTLEGGEIYNAMGFILFNGYYSVLPWIAFFFAGLLFGRSDVRPRGILPPSSILGIGLIIASFFVNRFAKKIENDVLMLQRSSFFLLNIRLHFPAFVIYAIGACIVFTNTMMYVFRHLAHKNALRIVQTLSSMKYSVLFFHTMIGVLTLTVTNLEFYSSRIVLFSYVVLATVLTVYLTFMWRKRVNEKGPMEWLIKRISGSAKK